MKRTLMDSFRYRGPMDTKVKIEGVGGGGGGAGAASGDRDGDDDVEKVRPPARKRTARPLLDLEDPCLERLSVCQRRLPEALLAGRNVFMTGRAGSGKTECLRATIEAMENADTVFAATAATGIAAVPLAGTTLHSQLCVFDNCEVERCAKMACGKKPSIRAIKVLIIDEISMISEEVLDKVLAVMREARPHDLPLVIMVGDFLQLPPVKGTWAFKSKAWETLNPVILNLEQNFRQREGPFMTLLDEARVGQLSPESIRMLRSRVHATPSVPAGGAGSSKSDVDTGPPVRPVVLLARRAEVDAINDGEMSKLVTADNPCRVFTASITLEVQVPMYDPERPKDPPEMVWRPSKGCVPMRGEDLHKGFAKARVVLPDGDPQVIQDVVKGFANLITPVVLSICVGAQVIFTANVSPPAIVNGTRGVVVDFDSASGKPLVKLASGDIVSVEAFRALRPVGPKNLSPAYVFTQVPLMAAWALTIHKSQGMSLDLMEADLGPTVFESGQAYVALSRARTLGGLTLKAFTHGAVRADAEVLEWHRAHGLI